MSLITQLGSEIFSDGQEENFYVKILPWRVIELWLSKKQEFCQVTRFIGNKIWDL